MKYRHSPYDFSLEVVPISISGLERVLRNSKVDVGGLFDVVAPLLYNTPGFRAGKYWFTLVNVTCSHTGFSYGLMEPPWEEVVPLAGTWYYTFALNDSGYNEDTVINYVSHRGVNMTVWGRTGAEFVTICTTHMQANALKLRYDMLTPEWVYYLLGALTKGLALRNRFYSNADDFSLLHGKQSIEMARSQYHMLPLYQLMRNIPYHLWVFNRHAWDLGANLLSVKHITVEALMYVCRYIRAVKPLPKLVEAAVVDKFHESLTDLIQRRDRQESPTEPWQLLYTALVSKKSMPDNNVSEWLAERESQIELPSGNLNTDILNYLYGNNDAFAES
jgi:hypothetical protein